MAVTKGLGVHQFSCTLWGNCNRNEFTGNLFPLPGENSQRRGGAGPAWAEVVAAELTGFNHGPDVPLAPL